MSGGYIGSSDFGYKNMNVRERVKNNKTLHINIATQFIAKYFIPRDHTKYTNIGPYMLQRTTQPSSKYQSTLFKVPRNPLQSTTQPSFKEAHHSL